MPGFELTAREQSRLWRHVGTLDNFWLSLREIEPGAVKRLAAVAAAHRWEVIFLTKRPASAGVTAQVQSQRWLVSKGFERPSVYVVQGSRGLIAAALDLDVVVDDRHENCYDVVVDSGARAILVWRGTGRAVLRRGRTPRRRGGSDGRGVPGRPQPARSPVALPVTSWQTPFRVDADVVDIGHPCRQTFMASL